MRLLRSLPSTFLIIIICLSCGKPTPTLDGIDQVAWKNDKNGCNGARAKMQAAIIKEKKKLLGLEQMEIIELLGRPDRNELYKRSQKFFLYFIQPSGSCRPSGTDDVSKLVIRFNAMGLAKEIAVE